MRMEEKAAAAASSAAYCDSVPNALAPDPLTHN
jgi:hypothetical protein